MIISGISIVQVLAILGQYISASYSRQFGISLQIRFYNGRVLTWSTKVSASTSAEHPWHMNAFLMNLELRKLLCITQLVLLLIQIEEFSLYYREIHAAFSISSVCSQIFQGSIVVWYSPVSDSIRHQFVPVYGDGHLGNGTEWSLPFHCRSIQLWP